MFVALKLIQDVLTKKSANQEKYCSLEDRVDRVSFTLIRTCFDFKRVTYTISTPFMFCLAFIVGIVGGVYGIGGGSIIAPVLVTFFKLPIYTTAGAVLLGTFTSSVAGVIFYSCIPIDGIVARPDWMLGTLFGIGGLLGMSFGARMQKHFSEKWIKIILGIIVFTAANRYILQLFT